MRSISCAYVIVQTETSPKLHELVEFYFNTGLRYKDIMGPILDLAATRIKGVVH